MFKRQRASGGSHGGGGSGAACTGCSAPVPTPGHTLCLSCYRASRDLPGLAAAACRGKGGGGRQQWGDPAWRKQEIMRRNGGGAAGGRVGFKGEGRCASAKCRRRIRAGGFCDQHQQHQHQHQQPVAVAVAAAAASTASLSPGQRAVLDAVLERKNVFFTGDAGTGNFT